MGVPDAVHHGFPGRRAELAVKFPFHKVDRRRHGAVKALAVRLTEIHQTCGIRQHGHHAGIVTVPLVQKHTRIIGNAYVVIKALDILINGVQRHFALYRSALVRPHVEIVVQNVVGIRLQKSLGVVGIKPLHHFAVEIKQTLGIGGVPQPLSARNGTENKIFVLLHTGRAERHPEPEMSVVARQGNICVVRSPAVRRRLVAHLVSGITELHAIYVTQLERHERM